MRDLVVFSATKHNLASALAADYDKDAPVFSACRDDLLAAAGTLLTRAQQAGAVRPDAQPLDLLRIFPTVWPPRPSAPPTASEAERLLSIVLNGLVTDPAGGSRTEC